jgi:HSP20 family molecular chaperone IbpA
MSNNSAWLVNDFTPINPSELALSMDLSGLSQQNVLVNINGGTFVGPRTITSFVTDNGQFFQTTIRPGTISIRYNETFAQRKYVPTAEFVNGVLTLYLNTIEKG